MLNKNYPKIILNSKQNIQKIQITERSKARFSKEQVGNAELYKPVLNKIMTTHEEFIKYNFAALLTCFN